MMESSDNNNDTSIYPSITIIKDSHLKLSLPTSKNQKSPFKLAIWKDERLDNPDISKGLIELLQMNGFTTELIFESGPSKIAEKLGIDDYIAQIIFDETTKKYK